VKTPNGWWKNILMVEKGRVLQEDGSVAKIRIINLYPFCMTATVDPTNSSFARKVQDKNIIKS